MVGATACEDDEDDDPSPDGNDAEEGAGWEGCSAGGGDFSTTWNGLDAS
jgi:hypothetical protein